jgi:hypothetical protein
MNVNNSINKKKVKCKENSYKLSVTLFNNN